MYQTAWKYMKYRIRHEIFIRLYIRVGASLSIFSSQNIPL